MTCGQWNDLTSISFWLLYFLLPKEAKKTIPLPSRNGAFMLPHIFAPPNNKKEKACFIICLF
jgi:hypothetical protein